MPAVQRARTRRHSRRRRRRCRHCRRCRRCHCCLTPLRGGTATAGAEGPIRGAAAAHLEEPASHPQTRLPRFRRVLRALTTGGAPRRAAAPSLHPARRVCARSKGSHRGGKKRANFVTRRRKSRKIDFATPGTRCMPDGIIGSVHAERSERRLSIRTRGTSDRHAYPSSSLSVIAEALPSIRGEQPPPRGSLRTEPQ